MALPSYIKEINNKVIFNNPNGGEIIYYIPERFFDLSGMAEIVGEYVEVIGIFNWVYIDDKGKSHGVKQFKCPTLVKCKPSLIDKVNNFELESVPEKQNYRCLHFNHGSELLSETNVASRADNVNLFINLFVRGNLPSYIPYNEIQDYLIENASINKFNYKVSNQVLGLLISELYRDKEDLATPFRLAKTDNPIAYQTMTIENVPKYISSYTSITSTNPDYAIAGAILNKGTANTHSPLEKIVID